MSTAAIAWMSPILPLPQLSDDPIENSKQVLKALKCVAFSSKQVGDMLKRRRERLALRLQNASDETELLRAHIVQNVLAQRQRLEQLQQLQEDVENAQTLGNPELLKDLADELKQLRREDERERELRRNLKRTVRSRVRARKSLESLKGAADEALVVFNCKHNLIQSMVATCSKTTFLSASELGYEEEGYDAEQSDEDDDCSRAASESDYDLSDCLEAEDIDMDVDFAAAQDDAHAYPKLRVAKPEDERSADERDESGEQSSVSAWSFESDSQASSSVKDSRRRSVSFGPLPLSGLEEEENVDMTRPLTLEELSDEGEQDDEARGGDTP